MSVWKNWSGSMKFSPEEILEPQDEKEIMRIVDDAVKTHKKIRVVGAGHSSSPLVLTKDLLVSLKKFNTVEETDRQNSTAWLGTGLTVKEGGIKILDHGLTFHNTGDVDVQLIMGAISTGTHGTGITLQNLSSMLIGCRVVCSDGQVKEFTEEKDGTEFFNAIRISLGTMGIITRMKLKLLPDFQLERKEWCTHTDQCMYHLDELIHENRNFDFYWYPRNDLVKLRTLNEPGKTRPLNYAHIVEEASDSVINILPQIRRLKFDEMEYAVPIDAGPSCFQEVRKAVKEKFREKVAWRVLYRTIKEDDFFLSPSYKRDTATISLHQNTGAPFMQYFRAIEPIFRHYGGRPHWGKKHTLKHAELETLYPQWGDFLKIREHLDPENLFINDYLKQIFGR